jgi:putative ABC transport system substrate-binding protein
MSVVIGSRVSKLSGPVLTWSGRRSLGHMLQCGYAGSKYPRAVLVVKRREFIAAVAALLVSPRRSLAQSPRRIGVLANSLESRRGIEAWQSIMREKGWIEGKNLLIEYRYAQTSDRFSALAAELVALSPDLLLASTSPPAVALKSATASIPIVVVGSYDPVGIGLVQSLSRPGGNITGLSTYVPGGFLSKRIEILRELVPSASKFAILLNPTNPTHTRPLAEEMSTTIRDLGVTLLVVEASAINELNIAFASAAAQRADAVIVLGDPVTNRPQVAALAIEHRLPAIYLFPRVPDGGLIAYGPDVSDLWRRAGTYVDKILKGSKPADLPVEQPIKFELVINMKTAKALGINVPATLLARADEVIE